MHVQGSSNVTPTCEGLDKKLYETTPKFKHFQIVVELHPEGSDQLVKKITFDERYLEDKVFRMDGAGVEITIHDFTCTRVREA